MKSLKFSTRQLLLASAIAMLLAAGLGSFFAPIANVSCTEDAQTMRDILLWCGSSSLGVLAVKILTVLALLTPANVAIRRIMRYISESELRQQMLTDDGNDSPAILTGALLFALVILVNGLSFTTPINYLIFLLFKGGETIILTVVISALLLFFRAGITNFEQVEGQIRLPGTNAVAILIGASMCAAALLV